MLAEPGKESHQDGNCALLIAVYPESPFYKPGVPFPLGMACSVPYLLLYASEI